MKLSTYYFQLLLIIFLFGLNAAYSQNRVRDYGITPGVLPAGEKNAITDVAGVKVGHVTLKEGDSVRTGVTAIIPHNGNVFQEKVPAAIHVGNGFGKLAGVTQIRELGNIETPVVLTNTLSVPAATEALVKYTLEQSGNEEVRSVNPVVGETNDGWLNDIRGMHVEDQHVFGAIQKAKSGSVQEGNVGAGTGTICFGFKGGIGTSSRALPEGKGGYKVGVLVQANFGGVLQIDGAPVGVEMDQYYMNDKLNDTADGSCMIVVATDAPLLSRNLERLAKRAMLGLAKTGGISSNGSGDYVIAFSTNEKVRIPYSSTKNFHDVKVLRNNAMSPLFMAVIEATEEAILNALFAAESMKSRSCHVVNELPEEKTIEILKNYNRLNDTEQ
jgi:D-aminopeptidase